MFMGRGEKAVTSMRIRIIYAIAAVLVAICWTARAGNEADARARSRCAAIGYELQTQVSAKRVDVGRWRFVNPPVARQWDDYLDQADRVGRSLVDTFAGPQPTRGSDRGWAAQQSLKDLTGAAKTCTGGKP